MSLTLSRSFALSLATVFVAASSASADGFPLSVELQTGLFDNFGYVEVDEDADGGLAFHVAIDPTVAGADADLHRLYFNLLGDFTGLSVVTEDPVSRAYVLGSGHPTAGGAGAEFDLSVHFGNGAGKRGNGILQDAHFTLLADQSLSIDDLLLVSMSSDGVAAHVAAKLQGASISAVAGMHEPEPEPDVGGDPPPDPGDCLIAVDLLTGEIIIICP